MSIWILYCTLFMHRPMLLSPKINCRKNVHEDDNVKINSRKEVGLQCLNLSPIVFHCIDVLMTLFFLYEPRSEKTGLWGFRPGPTQTRLYSHRRWLEALNFGFRKKRDCTIYVVKTKALISFAVTAKLICLFVFAFAKG